MNQDSLNKLKQLGITSTQINIYLACLELGTAQIGKIANQAKEKRTTTYAAIWELVEIGLLKSIKSGNKYLFTANNPDIIVKILEEQKDEMKELIPFLKEKYLQNNITPQLEVFYNKRIADLFAKILTSKEKNLLMIRSNVNKSTVIGREFHFGRDRRDKKLFAKVLLPRDTYKLQSDQQYFSNQKARLREVRLLPRELEMPGETFIFDNTVGIISSNEKFAFCVESKDFSALMKNMFNFLWELSKRT